MIDKLLELLFNPINSILNPELLESYYVFQLYGKCIKSVDEKFYYFLSQ